MRETVCSCQLEVVNIAPLISDRRKMIPDGRDSLLADDLKTYLDIRLCKSDEQLEQTST